jgi:phospholipid N-methyltransferase
VAAVKIRKRLDVNIMVGPPVDKEKDDFYIEQFLAGPSKKIVCGGTSSTIVARHLKTELKTSFDFPDKEVPPIGYIKGIDLTTEGVLTLRRLMQMLEKYISITDLTPKTFTKKDGASLLADYLFERATHITFFVGQSVNVAHQGLPIDTTMKMKIVEKIAADLRKVGKIVELNYY